MDDSASASASGDPDPMALVQGYTGDELAIAAEFLTTWLPFLSAGLCPSCVDSLRGRVSSLAPPQADESQPPPPQKLRIDQVEASGWDSDPAPPRHPPFEASGWDSDPAPPPPQPQPAEKQRKSWADMAQEDELAAAAEEDVSASAADDGEEGSAAGRPRAQPTREQRELRRLRGVVRRKDYKCLENVRGRQVNILAGLELHANVFSTAEQKRIVDCVYDLQEMGKRGDLGDRTYTEPEKWMRGKGRVTIQFGCCYNYATDKKGNPPGIIRTFASDPIPPMFKTMIKRLIRWHILPTDCVPDSCIVNIYEPGDCIPPHIDSHDFVRPFCTVSFLSECDILFGSSLKIAGPGEFTGSFAIPLPVGSVLVINSNGADVAKHCVPAVPSKRISITFRKMDPAKRPFSFKDEPDLLNIAPLEGAVQDSGRSSDEGKGKQPDLQNKNASRTPRSRRARGRTSSGKSEMGILGDQPPQHAQASVSSPSTDNERVSVGRLRESRYQQDAPVMQPQMGDARERLNWLREQKKHGGGVHLIENGAESREKRQSPQMDERPNRFPQERRNGNGVYFIGNGGASPSQERRHQPQMGDLRERLNQERKPGSGVYFVDNPAESRERRGQRMEHRQMAMINRTINDDVDSLSAKSHESGNQPHVTVRTIYNKPRTRVHLDE